MRLSEKAQRTIVFIAIVVIALSVVSMCMLSFIYLTITPVDSAPVLYEQMWDLWAGRIIAFLLIILLLVFLPVSSVWIKILNRKYLHLENMERIKQDAEAKTPRIVVNKATKTSNGEYIILRDTQIEFAKIGEFIKNAIDVGLSISAWRDRGFTQSEIELILDHLAELGVITDRQRGVSCEWRREMDSMRLARYFPVDFSEI